MLAALALAAALLLTACGKKGDPLPPLRNIPLTTTDLTVSQQGRQILLDMAYPSTTVSGLALGGIDALELFMLTKPVPPAPPEPAPPPALEAEVEADAAEATEDTDATETTDAVEEAESPKPPPLPSADAREMEGAGQSLLTLRGTELSSAVVGDRLQIRLPLAEPLPAEPVVNIFAARTFKGDEVSAFSNRVSLVPVAPPAAPSNLEAQATAGGIELTWEAAADTQGFDVFRRDAQVRGYGEAIQRVGGDQRRYLDAGARFGSRYIYTVRTVANVDPLIHSDEAGEREIEYEDHFAPPLPVNIVALAERASIRLRWEPSTADDVAGYVIFRREPGRDFHRLTPEPITGEEYLDRGLASGLTYAYRLRVIDHKGNESELSPPVETTAR